MFQDVREDNQSHCLSSENNDDDYVFDDELLDELNEILQNDELYDMIVDNLSLSQLHSSLFKKEHI